jgi:tetratricopeptide (TPR) repeat protein
MTDANPFFAVDAELLLKSKLFDKAIAVCQNGLAQYPLYFTGWKLLIEIYKSAGNIEEAINTADYALTLFPGSRDLQSLKDDVKSKNVDFRNFVFDDVNHSVEEKIESPVESDNFKNNLHEIAKKLNEVSKPVNNSEVKIGNINFQTGIVTETMAKIYISQGAFSEAISAYRHLIKTNPANESYYLSKIAEIEK